MKNLPKPIDLADLTESEFYLCLWARRACRARAWRETARQWGWNDRPIKQERAAQRAREWGERAREALKQFRRARAEAA